MAKPIIGIPSRIIKDDEYEIPAQGNCDAYVQSVIKAGGIPLLIPIVGEDNEAIRRYAEICDAFIFAGGEDLEPSTYKATPHPKLGKFSSARDQLELRIFTAARELGKPILGVCRGLQLINVAMGGDLYQDLPSEAPSSICHDTNKWKELPHDIEIDPNSRLAKAIGPEKKTVNSIHHQAIKNLAGELRSVATCKGDGIIEAVEAKTGPFLLAVQWHPEVLWQDSKDSDSNLEWNLGLFKALVKEVEQNSKR